MSSSVPNATDAPASTADAPAEAVPSKAYSPAEVERLWQGRWHQQGCFTADPAAVLDHGQPPYSIVIPPPNVTGVLHLGHVLNNTIQDILCRRARQQGRQVLWLPGTDHAGIATQSRVERHLRQTEKKTRHDLGRDAFLERVWDWKHKHGGIITDQLKALGCSLDWSRERFTMDPDYSRWVSKVFVDLFKEGLIYRGRRMVNWCPASLTALSDEEVIMKPQRSKLYTMRYRVAGQPGRFVEIATTRPETLMGDTGVAVHPDDPRYADLIGQHVVRPFPEAEIPVVADEHIDPEFGTGVLKVTPAHDKADYEIGQRHSLPAIDVLHPDGTINCPQVPELDGLDRFAARDKAAAMLEDLGALVNTEVHENNVGFSERADVPIEPRLSMQWFLKYPCVEQATAAVRDDNITFRPARWRKTYLHWMENIQDWCISRQLWWGHRVPVWYRRDKADELREQALDAGRIGTDLHVGTEPPDDPENWLQDDDVLDTWFSSWLWPFATMTGADGEPSPELRAFHPTSDLSTGPDIIFFWVARMIMASYRFTGELPFRNVFFHSIIRDIKGRKMSKSLGNSPDPLDLIASYGADGLRFGLLRIAPVGTDVRFDEKQIEEGRNFATKLWNAARYRMMQGDPQPSADAESGADELAAPLGTVDVDILARLDRLATDIDQAYADYRFNEIAGLLYEFFWSQFCDRYLEAAKLQLRPGADPGRRNATLVTIDTVLRRFLALLHPLMPHVTEELWSQLGFGQDDDGGRLLTSRALDDEPVLQGIDPADIGTRSSQAAGLYETAARLRNLKAEYQLQTRRDIPVLFVVDAANDGASDPEHLALLELLAGVDLTVATALDDLPQGTPRALTPLGEAAMPLAGLIDIDAERSRLGKERDKVAQEITRSRAKLDNPKFTDRAPEAVVNQERERLQEWQEKEAKLRAMIQALGA